MQKTGCAAHATTMRGDAPICFSISAGACFLLPRRLSGLSALRDVLSDLERKILWLSTWTIHNANHLRAEEDAIKVGGHQASSASLVSIMTALYFGVLKPEDRVAVKPHASPVFHAIQYLLGNQTR